MITLNPDKEVVAMVKQGLKESGGYCPCKLEITEDTKCMCTEFKEAKSGMCHCKLFIKVEQQRA